jgi:hypothetical protein
MMIWLSIDPGLKGAIIVWRDDMPHKVVRLRYVYDSSKLEAIRRLRALLSGITIHAAILEDVHGIVGDGAKSAYTFGFNNGLLEAILWLECEQVNKVSPMRWMNKMHAGLLKQTATKDRSRIVAELMYSEFLLANKVGPSEDGVHDALLIGTYWRDYGRESIDA